MKPDTFYSVREVKMAIGAFALAQLSGAREQESQRLEKSERLEEVA